MARRNYSQLMKITVAVGLALVVALGIYSRINPEEKAIIFGLACLVTLISVGVICSLEYVKQSIAHDSRLADLSDEEIQEHLEHRQEHPNRYLLEDLDEESTFSNASETKEMPAVDGDDSGKRGE